MSDSESEILIHDNDDWSPCDGCEPGYIGACSSCKFASPEINESLRYGDEG